MKLYLTPETKAYYMAEFKKAIECTDKDWDLDKGLKEILTAINKNPNVQTILSKRSEDLERDNSSFIQFVFCSSIEPKLQSIFESFEKFFGGFVAYAVFETGSVEPSKDKVSRSLKHMDCVANIERYTNIEIAHIQLWNDYEQIHELFWDMVKKYLVNIS